MLHKYWQVIGTSQRGHLNVGPSTWAPPFRNKQSYLANSWLPLNITGEEGRVLLTRCLMLYIAWRPVAIWRRTLCSLTVAPFYLQVATWRRTLCSLSVAPFYLVATWRRTLCSLTVAPLYLVATCRSTLCSLTVGPL